MLVGSRFLDCRGLGYPPIFTPVLTSISQLPILAFPRHPAVSFEVRKQSWTPAPRCAFSLRDPRIALDYGTTEGNYAAFRPNWWPSGAGRIISRPGWARACAPFCIRRGTALDAGLGRTPIALSLRRFLSVSRQHKAKLGYPVRGLLQHKSSAMLFSEKTVNSCQSASWLQPISGRFNA